METFIKKYKGNICGRVFLQQICRLKKTVFFIVKCSSNSGHLQIISEIVSKKIQVQISAIQKNTNLAKLFRSTLFRHILRQILLTKIFHGSKFKKLLRKCFVCISLSAVVAFFVHYCQIWQKVIEKSPFPRYNKKSQRNLSKKILSWSFSLFKFSQQFDGVL